MNESLELERLENEFTNVYDDLMNDELNIEECRKLLNKLVLLNTNMDDLFAKLIIKLRKKEKKNFIVFIIQFLISLICLICVTVCNTPLIFSAIALANLVGLVKNVKSTKQEKKDFVKIFKKGQSMTHLIKNCGTFLGQKIKLACNITQVDQNKEQDDVINEQVMLMTVNNIIYYCIYNDQPYLPFDEEQKEIAIRILQTDLDTEEKDLDKLMIIATEKLQKDLNFTRTLHKKQ